MNTRKSLNNQGKKYAGCEMILRAPLFFVNNVKKVYIFLVDNLKKVYILIIFKVKKVYACIENSIRSFCNGRMKNKVNAPL